MSSSVAHREAEAVEADGLPAELAARLLERAARLDDVTGLSDADLISSIDALERAKAACAAAQARLTARFVESQAEAATRLRARAQECSDAGDFEGWVAARDQARALEVEPPIPDRPGGRAQRSRSDRRMTLSRNGVSAQIGLARLESPARGARLANASVALVQHLPHTLAALSAGVLNERRAELVVRGTSHLTPELRTRVDAEVVGAHLDPADPTAPGGAGSWGDRELERRVRACADRLDAAAAVERCRIAKGERRVTVRPVPDAMAVVSAVLPVAQAVAVHAALTRAALSGKASGDERGKGQLMADTLVELVTGQAEASDVAVEVQVVITDRALLAGDETPAHVPGYGPVPAGWARDLLTSDLESSVTATARVGRPPDDAPRDAPGLSPPDEDQHDRTARAWVRRLFTHPDTGTLVAMESSRRLFPPGLRRFVVARDGTCRTPWCDAPVAHADHVTPHADGGATSAANGQGLCVRCNLVKEEPGWTSTVVGPGPGASSAVTSGAGVAGSRPHTVRVTTPTGHSYVSTAPPILPMTLPSQATSQPTSKPASQSTRIARPGNVIRFELYRRHDVHVELAG